MNNYEHSNQYSETGFWKVLSNNIQRLGTEALEKALMLYYALQNPQIPARAKAVIYGALGYLIMPLDVIPDVIPVVGFIDDIGILASAVVMVSLYIDAEVKVKAKQKVGEWFD
ncbi:YkvA family protein [Methylobacter psychrophilus]|uniref:YkvA family protein n=1 Tax=Methylobacter psychrophilus TaxID=96941 RepID=UPI0021D4AD88|nr:YkvA family protein [Methylobacter psychrophilus]